jgi:hypothetical protein
LEALGEVAGAETVGGGCEQPVAGGSLTGEGARPVESERLLDLCRQTLEPFRGLRTSQAIDFEGLEEKDGEGHPILPVAIELASDGANPGRWSLLPSFITYLDFLPPGAGRHRW